MAQACISVAVFRFFLYCQVYLCACSYELSYACSIIARVNQALKGFQRQGLVRAFS